MSGRVPNIYINVRTDPQFAERLDHLRAAERPIISRTEMMCRLVNAAWERRCAPKEKKRVTSHIESLARKLCAERAECICGDNRPPLVCIKRAEEMNEPAHD